MTPILIKGIWALASVVAGYLIGLVFEKIVLIKLRELVKKTRWEGVETLASALRWRAQFWFTLTGIYVAMLILPLAPNWLQLIRKVLLVLVLLSLTWFFAIISVGFLKVYLKKAEGILPSTTIFENLTRLVVFVVGILVILQSLGISITPILGALGIGGLAVALALQDTLSNLFSGLHILAARQVKPGDYVKLNSGEEGYVTDISWRNTTIRALPNNLIVVPNSRLASAIITNFSLPECEMSVVIPVGVSYDSDLEKVEQVTIEVAKEVMKEVEGGVPEFEPFIRYHTFGDFSINFTVILRAKEFVNQYLLKHEFVKRLHHRYKQEGIEIPFPIRTVYMKSSE